MYAKPLHLISFTYRRMHIYPWQMDPPNDHRSMLHCYIQEVSHITECTYTHDRWTLLPINHTPMLHCYTFPCQLTIDPCNTITPHKSQIGHNAYIPMADPYTKAVSHIGECHGRQTPQLRIDALNTVTPNLAHLLADLPPVNRA